jgi:hypothetical protein
MWKVIGIIAIVIAIVGGISRCVASPERGDSGEVVGAGTEAVTDIRYGDCLTEVVSDSSSMVSGDLPVVPCSQPHVYEVIGVVNSSAGTYTDSGISTEADNYCRSSFSSYVGVDVDDSSLTFFTLTPTSGSWGNGDREITCLIANQSESSVTGSYKGSGL